VAIRQKDLRTETRPTRVVAAPRVKKTRALPTDAARRRERSGVAAHHDVVVTFGTIAVASASEGQSTANGGSAWSIMIHDLVYLGFGIFALYLASRVRLDRLVRAAPVLIIFGSDSWSRCARSV